MRSEQRRRFEQRVSIGVLVLLVSLAAHVLLLAAGGLLLPYLTPDDDTPYRVSWVVSRPDRPPVEEDPPEEEEEDPELDGQLVEIAPSNDERPLEAEYLAQYDQTVPEETRTQEFRINPEVVSPLPSEESRIEQSDPAEDVDVDRPSTGATAGSEAFDPHEDGAMASLPSAWRKTNKDGLQDPVPAASLRSILAGSPQNDLVDEEVGDRMALNTKEVLYASYLLRIRRLVNFYWEQNLDNLPRSVRIVKPRYTTTVEVVLDGDGALDKIEVSDASGVVELDTAVVRAFELAGPFPNPPAGLVEPDGRVYLPTMSWTVEFHAARSQFQGVDPNAGVQFPGMLKSPR